MTRRLRSHLSLVEDACMKKPHAPAFRLPVTQPGTQTVVEWNVITYQQFYLDILAQASFWGPILRNHGVGKGSVVTVWIEGMSYADVTLTYGLSRAGYTVELISHSIDNPDAVFNLIDLSSSKFLICDACKREDIQNSQDQAKAKCPVSVYWYSSDTHMTALAGGAAAPDEHMPRTVEELMEDPKGVAFILHTSGSTSGMPKLVPWSWEWMDTSIKTCSTVFPPTDGAMSWVGNACHAGLNFGLANTFFHCTAVIQPTRLNFSSDELKDMIKRCNLRVLFQFPGYFAAHVKRAKDDPELLTMLKNLDGIFLGGMPMTEGDLAWCLKEKLPLVFVFGSTECGLILRSQPTHLPLLYELHVEPEALQFKSINQNPNEISASCDMKRHGEQAEDLRELVVHGTSKRCPASSLLSEDENYHSGDLFVEVSPGRFQSKGRGDDWIKLAHAGRCDTCAIENNVLLTCGSDLVHACIIIGSSRPEILLIVELHPKFPSPGPEEELEHIKAEILRRLAPGQKNMWTWEKVLHTRQIRMVDMGSLPRTLKGNIKRKEVEAMLEE